MHAGGGPALTLPAPSVRLAVGLLAVTVAALVALEVELLFSAGIGPVAELVPFPAIACLYLVAGLVAWTRRSSNHLGALMVCSALAWLAAGLLNVRISALEAAGFICALLPIAAVLHLLLGFPAGMLRSRADRLVVAGMYVVMVVLQAPSYLFGQGAIPPVPGLSIGNDAGLAVAAGWTRAGCSAVLAVVTIWLLARRHHAADDRQRRVLGPLYCYGMFAFLFVAIVASPLALLIGDWDVGLAQEVLLAGIPLAFAIAVARGGFSTMTGVDQTSAWLAMRADGIGGLDAVLASSLGDPTAHLAIAGEPTRVSAGQPARASNRTPGRGLVEITLDGREIGTIDYDATLIGDPRVVDATGRALALAVDHARVTNELVASREQVRHSRARIVAATDRERMRIAQDLHDGIQGRLVVHGIEAAVLSRDEAASLELKTSAERLRAGLDQTARELREVTHGLMPPALAEHGLTAAIEDLVSRSPVPTSLIVDDAPPALTPPGSPAELTAYYVIAEALTNALKHANAQTLEVRLGRQEGCLRIEVGDDGVGGAATNGGAGLRNIADRIDVLGGTLAVASPVGGGTRVVVEIPCAS
jgi:signal transduction histidine kinase